MKLRQLTGIGAQVVAETGNAHDGLQLRYTAGKTRGVIRIEPPENLEQYEVTGHEPLCPGEVPISIRIRIEEKWIKSAA